jgi:N-acetylneuraminate synthase
MNSVTILGAGISGLVCAFEFIKKGWKVRILERSSTPGGMVKTKRYKDYHYDLGPHIYHTYDNNTLKYWKENFKGMFIEKHFFSKNSKDGKLYDYPLAWESIEHFPEDLKIKIKKELKEAKNSELKKRAKNYKEYVTGIVGPTLQQMFYEKYPQKLWGIPTTDISPNWAPKRIEFRDKYEAFYYDQWSGVAKYGSGTIPDMLAKKIVELGGEILYEHEIIGVNTKNNAINKLYTKNKEFEIEKDEIIISTIPITKMGSFLGISSTLKFKAVVLAFLIIKKFPVLPENLDWLYYDNPDYLFHRVTDQRKLNPENFRDDTTLLCFEISCDQNSEIYNEKDENLIKKVKEQFISTNLVKENEIVDSFVDKIPAVYPFQTVGFEHEKIKVLNKIEKVSNLHTTGTLAEFGYFDMQILFCKSRDLVNLIEKSEDIQREKKKTVEIDFNKEINLGELNVGGKNPSFIIAEAGLNHNGSLEIAKELIKKAKESGANAVKFQTFKAGSRVSSKVKSAKYVEKTTGLEESFYDMFKRLELSKEDHFELMAYAKDIGIPLISTPFDEESADLLEEIGINMYKVASMDLINLHLIKHIAKKGKPMILSTGMGTLGEIEEALEAIMKTGNKNISLLHCISSYPTPAEEMNLNAIKTMARAFNVPIGLSDHTVGSLIPTTAVALGAKIIEKHFTLDNKMEGPDQIFSSTPEEMKSMIERIRTVEKALGNGIKKPRNIEYRTAQLFKKSIFAKKDIRAGTVITKDMLEIKGPALGMQPKFMEIIIGRKANRNILEDHPIEWEDI